jgi:hypothetical protein
VEIERTSGCSHLTCGNCGTHLCERCGKAFGPHEIYPHIWGNGGQPCPGDEAYRKHYATAGITVGDAPGYGAFDDDEEW